VMPPDNLSWAPLDTVVLPAVVPNAVLFAATNVPAPTVVLPVNELFPDNVSVLAPDFVTEPPDPEMTPANVVEVPEAPLTVSVFAGEPEVLSVMVEPEPDPDVAIDATVSENPAKLNDASLAMDTAEEFEMRSAAPKARVPALIVVVPVYVFAPEIVNVPEPALVRPPLPDMTPLYVVAELSPPAVRVAEPRVMLPAPEMEPTVSL
jgi:hypothetical protein